ncbi:MAG: lysophospholipid acyltransferase family protein [Verrucomicrobia bacterium]|nr:lysophospholipid acyltransferase family protein [Verrucomicrobiota bacterium]
MEAASSKVNVHHSTSNGIVVPHRLPWPKRLLASLIYALIRVVAGTIRFNFEDRSGLFQGEPPQPVIYCTWHNRLALALMVFLKHPKKLQPARRMAAIVSASKDGAVVAHILELFGAQPVRGSSSRRGPQALLELTTWAERGFDLAITPDGPRGPCYVVQDGAIAVAQLTGLPLVPVTYHLNWKIRPKSWDRFQIPLPFARCTVILGEPLLVPREARDKERETLRRRLQEQLRTLTND